MKQIEWKLLSELMKNSRRSDRELARAIGASLSSVSRMRKRLEAEGYIREYTMIPDFSKLNYEILAVTFIKLKKALSRKQIEEARRTSSETAIQSSTAGPFNAIMAERGMGLGYDGIIISLHETYDSFKKDKEWLRNFAFLELRETQSFLVSLNDRVRYLPLTLAYLANHILERRIKADVNEDISKQTQA